MKEIKRFSVGVVNGFHFHDKDISYCYENHFFDTFGEAEKFIADHPDCECTAVFDLENLPF